MTWMSGQASRMWAVAVAPSITGISTSMRTTSGFDLRAELHRLGSVRGLAHHLEVVVRREEHLESLADHVVVIHDHHPDALRVVHV